MNNQTEESKFDASSFEVAVHAGRKKNALLKVHRIDTFQVAVFSMTRPHHWQ